ncbi:ras-related protein Rap-1A-like [Haliotis rubra]|uniref:ras-related protein Rap-1A-like n=1 Tax=Haliotis rubra TaxID=36100 RepID=UPI001EE5D882|nr:ras-related protein Rap-1A-like [Haliotis rubra]
MASLRSALRRLTTRRHSTRSVLAYRMVVLGKTGVGKTAIISQFRQRELKEDESTYNIERAVFKTHNALLSLDIVDTAGIHRAFPMLEFSICKSDAFMLVYSVDDQESFEMMQRLRHEIIELKMDKDVPIVVVANKQDLPDDEKAVPCNAAEYLIRRKWRHGYVEASSFNYDQVCEAFKQIVRQLTRNVSLTPVLKRRSPSVAGPAPGPQRSSFITFLRGLLKKRDV